MNKNSKKKSGHISTTGLRREFSNLSCFFQSINSGKDNSKRIKQNRSIKPHHYNFITSKNLGKLSSFDTLEKKKSSKKKRKISGTNQFPRRLLQILKVKKKYMLKKERKVIIISFLANQKIVCYLSKPIYQMNIQN